MTIKAQSSRFKVGIALALGLVAGSIRTSGQQRPGQATPTPAAPQTYSVTAFGATVSGVEYTNCTVAAGTNTVTVSGGIFTAADVGKVIGIAGAGTAGNTLISIITNVVSANTVQISNLVVTTPTLASGYFTGWTPWMAYGWDDTAAVQKAINTICSNGGGVLQFPSGIAVIAGAIADPGSTTNHNNSQLALPPIASAGALSPTITFAGVQQPTVNNNGFLTWRAANLAGFSTLFFLTPGEGTIGMSCQNYATPWYKSTNAGSASFNNVGVFFEKMCIFGGTNGPVIDFRGANNAWMDRCLVESGWTQYAGAPQTDTNSVGVIMPGAGNGGPNGIKDSTIMGFWSGAQVSDHCTLDHLTEFECSNAIFCLSAGHQVALFGCDLETCKVQFLVNTNTALGPLEIAGSYTIENNNTDWTQNPVFVQDTGGNGDVNQFLNGDVFVECTGISWDPTANGCANTRCTVHVGPANGSTYVVTYRPVCANLNVLGFAGFANFASGFNGDGSFYTGYAGDMGAGNGAMSGNLQITGGIGGTITNRTTAVYSATTSVVSNTMTNTDVWLDLTVSAGTVVLFDANSNAYSTNAALTGVLNPILQPKGWLTNTASAVTVNGAHAFP